MAPSLRLRSRARDGAQTLALPVTKSISASASNSESVSPRCHLHHETQKTTPKPRKCACNSCGVTGFLRRVGATGNGRCEWEGGPRKLRKTSFHSYINSSVPPPRRPPSPPPGPPASPSPNRARRVSLAPGRRARLSPSLSSFFTRVLQVSFITWPDRPIRVWTSEVSGVQDAFSACVASSAPVRITASACNIQNCSISSPPVIPVQRPPPVT